MKIGILALQGDFEMHQKMVRRMRIPSMLVKRPEDLEQCDGLIIPGGESTTFMNLIDRIGLKKAIEDFYSKKPVFGTCAGSIILSKNVIGETRYQTFGAIDVDIQRNAYGRQIDSFIDNLFIDSVIDQDNSLFEGVFIRAPKIQRIGKKVKVLATYNDYPVMVEEGLVMIATFHPELTKDTRIHNYFIQKVQSTL
ncbi:MAG: pyridoxal 5'-phosphate synthase glutaminase subunit PdxT [Calditrichia bacterium]